jgi:hypothetical protein
MKAPEVARRFQEPPRHAGKILGGRTLRATSRPSFVSVARYTSPIPPAPIAAVIR